MSTPRIQICKLSVPFILRDEFHSTGAVRLLPLHRALPRHRTAAGDEQLPSVIFGAHGTNDRRGADALSQVTSLVYEHRGLPAEVANMVVERLRRLDLAFLLHSLHPAGEDPEEEASFRLVLPLSRSLAPGELADAWRALHGDIGGHALASSAAPGRAWTVPWCLPELVGCATYELRDGLLVDVDRLLGERTLLTDLPEGLPEPRTSPRRRRRRRLSPRPGGARGRA